jgi:very-short-patch-repair endonuclease/predicted transcriptional regulator of viral defense system
VASKKPHTARQIDATPSIDAVLARIAARQHGLVRLAQLLAAGLSRQTIARRVREGRLHRVYQGVYALGHRGLSRHGLWLAAVLAAGEGAALSQLCAAALWDLRELRTDFVDVVAPTRRRLTGPIRVHASRTLDPSDVTKRRGIPVTTVARTLVDLTDIQTPHQLANVIHEAAYRRRFSVAATRAAMARATGRQNLRVLEKALALNAGGSAGTRSANEDAFLSLLQSAAIPEPRVNTQLLGEEVDCHWPARKLVVEVDGEGHARPRARRDDARRDEVLRKAGWRVLRFSGDDIELRPREVIARLRAA